MGTISAADFMELHAALQTAQAGDAIVLTGSDYPVSFPVTVPPNVTLRSAGAVMIYSSGYPDQLAGNVVPVIRPDGEAYEVGNLIELSDGSRLERIVVTDHVGRLGNPVAVLARAANETIHAAIVECEIY